MVNIIEKIKQSRTLESYVEEKTGLKWKKMGNTKDISPCPACGGSDCFRLAPAGFVKCFQCGLVAFDILQFRCQLENLTYKEAVIKFTEDLGIKKYEKRDVDWYAMREDFCELSREILFTCQTVYQWRGMKTNPLNYLIDYRKHTYDAILHFRLGFNDGSLIEKITALYDKETVKASGLSYIPEGCFVYPFIVNGNLSYFRSKDPNRIKKQQMPKTVRTIDSHWFNQDVIKNGAEPFLVEGEDDVVSLWDCGVEAAGAVGVITKDKIDYLKGFELLTVYTCFDNDIEGQRDTEKVVKGYENTNTFVVKIPDDRKDIDEVVRDTEDKNALVEQLKRTAEIPSPEIRSLIKQKTDGYYISKSTQNGILDHKLTNWIGTVEAIIIQAEDLRVRKVKIKHGGYENTVFMDGTVLSNAGKFREFLLNNCNETCLFQGNDNDLNALVQYWGVAYKPKIIKETDCVGEIPEGFIADNIFVSNESEIKPLVNGYLMLDDKRSLKIAELFTQAGERSEVPYYPLTEPIGGIESFKESVFKLLLKNRNLKVAIAIGWFKACLWSKMFFKQNKFFPLLMIHGKKESGKSVLCSWLMNMIGLENAHAVSLREHGTTGVGIERKLAYLSSLPVWADDYRNQVGEGQKFHGFFRNVFDRSSAPKGIKNDAMKIRQVVVRGCLVIDGETATNDAGLNSRLVTFEITQQERDDKYYDEILKIEPYLAYIGFDWVKNRIPAYTVFEAKYKEIRALFKQKIASPRQAQVWAVAVASALTEPYFAKEKEKLCNYAIKLANHEIEQQKSEELIGMLWEATDVLHKVGKLEQQIVYCNMVDKQLEIHLPVLLGEIGGNPHTRKYELPSNREVSKILKQEPYVLGNELSKVDGKVARRWQVDLTHEKTPDVLKNMFDFGAEVQKEGGTDGL